MARLAKGLIHKRKPLSSMLRAHMKWQGVVAQACNHSPVEAEVGRPCSSLASEPLKSERLKQQSGHSLG